MASVGNHLTLAEVERNHILDTLANCENNRTRAARSLGISIRCLRMKLQQYSREGFEVLPPSASERGSRRVT